jgi:hypothetical protein
MELKLKKTLKKKRKKTSKEIKQAKKPPKLNLSNVDSNKKPTTPQFSQFSQIYFSAQNISPKSRNQISCNTQTQICLILIIQAAPLNSKKPKKSSNSISQTQESQ